MTYDPAVPVDISTWSERDRLAAILVREKSGVDDDTIAFYRSRYGRAAKDYWGEALITADAIIAGGFGLRADADEWLHVIRADGMDLCTYDDEAWPCAAERQRLADNPEVAEKEAALDSVLNVIRDSIVDAAYGLEVEDTYGGLVISWPLDVEHPQPPGVPSSIRVTVTDADEF